jgi:hypothetical protein
MLFDLVASQDRLDEKVEPARVFLALSAERLPVEGLAADFH